MSMTTIDKRRHAFKRRINVRAIRDDVFKSMEEPMLKNIRYFCSILTDADTKGWSSARDMTKTVSYLMSDIMGDFVFSQNWNVQRSPENRYIIEFLPQGVAGVNLVSTSFFGLSSIQITLSEASF
jgi:hypothetical protein